MLDVILRKGGEYIMSDRTLLKEVLTEEKVEKKLEKQVEIATEKEVSTYSSTENKVAEEEKTINIFSSASFPISQVERLKRKYLDEEREINKIESKVSDVIEKPNYDTMETLTEVERKKIFVFKKAEGAKKTSPNKFKVAIISILFALFTIWGTVNVAMIDNVSSQISQVSTQYKINLGNYLQKLYTLDISNSENMENLFETIPDESVPPTQIDEKSNWFDRFCNFIGGLFGG